MKIIPKQSFFSPGLVAWTFMILYFCWKVRLRYSSHQMADMMPYPATPVHMPGLSFRPGPEPGTFVPWQPGMPDPMRHMRSRLHQSLENYTNYYHGNMVGHVLHGC